MLESFNAARARRTLLVTPGWSGNSSRPIWRASPRTRIASISKPPSTATPDQQTLEIRRLLAHQAVS